MVFRQARWEAVGRAGLVSEVPLRHFLGGCFQPGTQRGQDGPWGHKDTAELWIYFVESQWDSGRDLLAQSWAVRLGFGLGT